jgi:heme/copper-type cytochrome/quinol oxidase subunit 4
VATSPATYVPTRAMRWLGLVGLAGGVLLLWAFFSFEPFQTRAANMVRLITFALGQAAVALAFYRRMATAAPGLARVVTALVVFGGVGYAIWIIVALWVPSPYSGTFGALNFFGNGLLWLSAAALGAALLRTGAVSTGMTGPLGPAARLGAIALLGSTFGWIGDDRLGLVHSEPYGELIEAIALFGVFLNGCGWVLLGTVLLLGGRRARTACLTSAG